MSLPPGGKTPPKKKPALGRGLAALLGDDLAPAREGAPEAVPGDKIIELPLERLEPNPYQPRRVFDEDALQALAASIKEQGVLQPLVVRPVDTGYQLIAGERRFRASQMAGLEKVPVVVRQATDQQALLLALLENLQREDLGCMEEARAYHRLAEEFSLTQDEIASGVGKDRSTVANALRLLKLPALIQEDLASLRLSAGHGRALLGLPEAKMRLVRDSILAKGLSVRQAEKLVKELNALPKTPTQPSQDRIHMEELSTNLARRLGCKVEIKRKGRTGSIVLRFASDKELERLLEVLG